MARSSSVLSDLPVLPLAESFALTAVYNADTFPDKVNLGQGVYRDEECQPWILPSVRRVRSVSQSARGPLSDNTPRPKRFYTVSVSTMNTFQFPGHLNSSPKLAISFSALQLPETRTLAACKPSQEPAPTISPHCSALAIFDPRMSSSPIPPGTTTI